MSERFEIYQDSIRKSESNRIWGVKSETNSLESYMTFKEAEKCCNLLNKQQVQIEVYEKSLIRKSKEISEQQTTIKFLQDEINELKKDIDIYKYEEKKHSESARKLYEENERLKLKINGLEFALKYIKRIDVEIDLNE